MSIAFLPACPPFGDFVVFLFDDRVEVIVQSHALTRLVDPAASLVDCLAEDVEQCGATVWKFTYHHLFWFQLCYMLGELYDDWLPKRGDIDPRLMRVAKTGQVTPISATAEWARRAT